MDNALKFELGVEHQPGFRRVDKDEFYGTVGQLNVHPRPEFRTVRTDLFPEGRKLCTSYFMTWNQIECGRVIEVLPNDSALPVNTYYIKESKS